MMTIARIFVNLMVHRRLWVIGVVGPRFHHERGPVRSAGPSTELAGSGVSLIDVPLVMVPLQDHPPADNAKG